MDNKSQYQTPDYSCLSEEDKKFVYEPAEDSFLLLDSLEKDYDAILALRPAISLEIGCGSGIISTFIKQMFPTSIYALCTDINPRATECTQKISKSNNNPVEAITSDLHQCFSDRLHGNVDLLVFNPPYVVTPTEEIGSNGIEASWAGGIDGREVLDRLLPSISRLLSPTGLFYLVCIKENKIGDIEAMLNNQGLSMVEVMRRRSGPELLSVLRFQRSSIG